MLTGPEVPTVTRAQVIEAIRVLGIDASSVRSLVISRHHIEAELMVVNEQGRRCAAGDEVATAVIQIPIADSTFSVSTSEVA